MDLDAIKERITPGPDERDVEAKALERVLEILSAYPVEPILVGSLAKDTDLSGNKDMDVFIQFPPETGRQELERDGLRIGKAVLASLGVNHEIDYAEHPYVKGDYSGFTIEIVPCYKGPKIMSAVDRTPFHTRYVKDRIDGTDLRGDIRLLKQFMRGQSVYGAEAKVEGFSGYLVELLIIEAGSFEDALKMADAWKDMPVLDIEGLWDGKKGMEALFPEANIIVIDPVDSNRNVAAAVSTRALARFQLAAGRYLKAPSEDFFFPKPRKALPQDELLGLMRKRRTRFAAICFRHGKKNVNTLYSQLRKTAKHIEKSLTELEFIVFGADIWSDDENSSILLLEFELWELPALVHLFGPPASMGGEHTRRFLDKHGKGKAYVKDGRWVVDADRVHTSAETALPEIVKKRDGFGKHFRSMDDAKIIWDADILGVEDEGWTTFLSDYLG